LCPSQVRGFKAENRLVTGAPAKDMLSHMKRTTMVLAPALFATLKRRAADEGRTLTEVVERLLRLGLQASAAARRGRVQLPSYDLGPYLVDPGDRRGLIEVLGRLESDETGRIPARSRGGATRSGASRGETS
jgi:hypothetical protein